MAAAAYAVHAESGFRKTPAASQSLRVARFPWEEHLRVIVALRPRLLDRPPPMFAILDWLKPWKPTPETVVGEPSPQCGTGSVQPVPHCGEEIDAGPQCGDDSVQRAEEALTALEKAWRLAAEVPHCGEPSWSKDPKELAIQFRRCLQGQRDLIGFWINREWVKEHYPLFCQALVVARAPAYKDFAEQLALMLPRKRKEIWSEGRRIKNFTAYRVLDPDDAVVELAQEKRKRA